MHVRTVVDFQGNFYLFIWFSIKFSIQDWKTVIVIKELKQNTALYNWEKGGDDNSVFNLNKERLKMYVTSTHFYLRTIHYFLLRNAWKWKEKSPSKIN